MFELRTYQREISRKGSEILASRKVLILAMEVRTGKSHIALEIGKDYKNVLFVTKKKAIPSIEADYKAANHSFDITVINYESLHKIEGDFDLVVCDESHCISSYPRPAVRTKELKKLVTNNLILMTGTLLPESNAQIYHQLWISPHSPFKQYPSFYKWHKHFGIPGVIYTSYGQSNDYSKVKYELIQPYIEPIMITYTQAQAGFKSQINEVILDVPMSDKTKELAERLMRDLVIEGKKETILAETRVKLMQKLHQIYSGTVKFESGNSMIIDYSKAIYIKDKFKGKKLAIFYKFKEEFNAISEHLDVTTDIEEFNNTDKHIALQIVAGREGINLSAADAIVMYNIDFSAVSYFQARDRMTTKSRKESMVYWLFGIHGIEYKIYKAVMNKKNFTKQVFEHYYYA